MKIGVIGSGMVAKAIGSKLAERGHQVKLGSRDPGKLQEWVAGAGPNVSAGTFAEAAEFGELLFNCTNGEGSLPALNAAGADNLADKVLVDIANPLDFSHGMPPSLSVCNTDSLAEQIQRAFPQTKIVKSLNTMNCEVMVNPSLVPGDHDVFVSGNDAAAKAAVTDLLKTEFGWQSVLDLGDLSSARATEMLLPIWLRLYGALQTPNFNFKIVR